MSCTTAPARQSVGHTGGMCALALQMWTKLRPGVREFLSQASQSFELWIHTNGATALVFLLPYVLRTCVRGHQPCLGQALGLCSSPGPAATLAGRLAPCHAGVLVWVAGNRAYAASVTRLLDPAGVFFGDRIIAQGADRVDQMQADQAKQLMHGLEGREAVTVIVDDSHSVWSEHRPNLVAVERYVYFPSSRTSLGMKGPSLLEANRCLPACCLCWACAKSGAFCPGHQPSAPRAGCGLWQLASGLAMWVLIGAAVRCRDESPEQGMLMVALDVLMRVHRRIFAALAAHEPCDVRQALTSERQRVLAGVRIVFSRVIPLEMQPQHHPLWQLAETYGAACTNQLDARVSHLVATTGGTEKVCPPACWPALSASLVACKEALQRHGT